MTASADATASGGFYVSSAVGDTTDPIDGAASGLVMCTFEVKSAGKRYVWVRHAADTAQHDSVYASIDGETVANTGGVNIYDVGESRDCATGDYQTYWGASAGDFRYAWTRLGSRSTNCSGNTGAGGVGYPKSDAPGGSMGVTLSAGTHTLTFYGREADARLDRVWITSDPEATPDQLDAPSPTPTPGTTSCGPGYCRKVISCNHHRAARCVPCNVDVNRIPCPWR